MGMILGFPQCCVEAWVRDHTNAAIPSGELRGCITERKRSVEEIALLNKQISGMLGREWKIQHPYKLYVPCASCMVKHEEAFLVVC
jgi:hypothetical protein